jgi:hypothetical protein
MFEEGVGMRLARAAQFSQRNRKCGGKGFELPCPEKKQRGEANAKLLALTCVLREVRLLKILEKRHAEAKLYIFTDQATGGGIRMVA